MVCLMLRRDPITCSAYASVSQSLLGRSKPSQPLLLPSILFSVLLVTGDRVVSSRSRGHILRRALNLPKKVDGYLRSGQSLLEGKIFAGWACL